MKSITLSAAAFLLALSAGSAHAQTFAESADAGTTETTAAIVPPMVNRITGTLKQGTGNAFEADPVDVDVYAFTISRATSVAIEANSTEFDTNLLLLKEGFFGLYGDDNGGPGNNSKIPNDANPLVLTPGTYYVAVGINNMGAYPPDAPGVAFYDWDNDFNRLSGSNLTTPIAFIGSSTAVETMGQAYEIRFNFTTGVTGIDQAAGSKLSKLVGKDFVNGTGKGQTVAIEGKARGKFVIITKNAAFARSVKSTLIRSLAGVKFTAIAFQNGGSNVTAQLKSSGYTTLIPSGGAVNYNFKVNRRGDSPLTAPVLLRSADTGKPSVADVAGAKVQLR